jgi:nitrilase
MNAIELTSGTTQERNTRRSIVVKQRVAVVQAGSSLFNTPATLERMRTHCETAKREGVQVLVFPEAYIGGYG